MIVDEFRVDVEDRVRARVEIGIGIEVRIGVEVRRDVRRRQAPAGLPATGATRPEAMEQLERLSQAIGDAERCPAARHRRDRGPPRLGPSGIHRNGPARGDF